MIGEIKSKLLRSRSKVSRSEAVYQVPKRRTIYTVAAEAGRRAPGYRRRRDGDGAAAGTC